MLTLTLVLFKPLVDTLGMNYSFKIQRHQYKSFFLYKTCFCTVRAQSTYIYLLPNKLTLS